VTDQDIPFIDADISQMPRDIRADLAERGRRSLYFFAKGVLQYRDMTDRCHKPLCEFFDYNPSLFKLTLMPRGHYKSTIATISRSLQEVCRDPNERILIANETSTNAQRFLSAIRQHVETNQVFRALYSEIIPKDYRKVPSWSNESLTFVREWRGGEPTLDTMGMTGSMTSRHYTRIKVDDPISEEAAKSPTVMQDVITRIDKLFSLMVKPKEDSFELTGTRWALHDVYSYFLKKLGHRFAIFARGVVDPEGELLFPELIDEAILADIRNTIGEYMFSCLYMNSPRDVANQDFNVEDLKYWRWSTDEESVLLYARDGTIEEEWPIERLDITVSVDLAVSEAITSDRNAIITVGCTPTGKAVVLHTFVKRCTPLDVIEHLFWLKNRFAVRAFGIEDVAYQKAFKYFLRAEFERRNQYMNIVPLKAVPSKRATGNNSKHTRIRGLQPVAATGRLYILPTQHELRNELADFPLGEHDDSIDALAHQLVMWRGLLSQARMSKYKASEEKLFRSIRAGFGGVLIPGQEGFDDPEDFGDLVPRFSQESGIILQ
jgi:hypothetical protein